MTLSLEQKERNPTNITKKGLILLGLALIMFFSSGQNVALAAPWPPSNQQDPALAVTGKQYLVLWTDDGGENLDILGKRVFAHGLPIGGPEGHEFGVAVGPGNDMAGEYLVVWSDDRNPNFDLFGLRVYANGLPNGRDFPVFTDN
jgi:hypothetical protein